MNRAEHQLRRKIIVSIADRMAAEEIGTPTLEDFIFIDQTFEPARIARWDGKLWLFYWHPDGCWITREQVCDSMAPWMWDLCTVLSPSQIKSKNLLGGVKLKGLPSSSGTTSEISDEPTTKTYGTSGDNTDS